MLVLRRKVDEVICIGDDIRVMVTRIGDNYVSLGIDTPTNVKVRRQELYERVRIEIVNQSKESHAASFD